MLSVQDKQTGSDDPLSYGEFEQVFAFRDGNLQNRFKDETCTYCNKKGHTETIRFAKRNDNKMAMMAKTISAAMAKKAMESIFDTFKKMHL